MTSSFVWWLILVNIISMFVGGYFGALIAIKVMLKEIRGGKKDGRS